MSSRLPTQGCTRASSVSAGNERLPVMRKPDTLTDTPSGMLMAGRTGASMTRGGVWGGSGGGGGRRVSSSNWPALPGTWDQAAPMHISSAAKSAGPRAAQGPVAEDRAGQRKGLKGC